MSDPSDIPAESPALDALDLSVLVESPKWEKSITDLEDRIPQLLLKIRDTLIDLKESFPFFQGIAILLTTDSHVQELNRDFRDKDEPTNVLSFPVYSAEELQELPALLPQHKKSNQPPLILGDIALAYETIEREANEQQKLFIDHATHLIVHGILHLLGYDHMTEEEQNHMEELEIHILSQLHIRNPYNDY